jgi:hypothetical protein
MQLDLELPVVTDARKGDPLPQHPAFIEVGRMGGEPVLFLHDPERLDRTERAFDDYGDWP